MPTLAERLETATTTLEGLVANTTGTGDMVLKTGAVIAPSSVNGNTITTGTGTLTLGSFALVIGGNITFSNPGRILAATVNASPATGDIPYFSSGSAAGTFPSNAYFRDAASTMTAVGFALVSTATTISGTYGGTGVNNGVKTITLGGNLATSGAFALTLTLTATTNVTLPTSGTVTTEERLMRQKRFAVGVSAATISSSNSAWNALITNGSSGLARLHSYFNLSTSTTLSGSKYSFWVEAGATAVAPHAFAGHPFYGLNFAKGLEISFPLQIAQVSSATAVLPSDGYLSGYFGQARSTHYEDIVQVGFGFLLKGDGTIQLQALATNGGSVVKSSFVASGLDMSVNASAVASLIRITSDTAGNLTLFIDGVSKCTLAGGPTGLTNISTSSFSVFSFTISNGAGTPTKATGCTVGEPTFIL